MYERMLNKQQKPAIEEMVDYCGATGELFVELNNWLSDSFETEQKQVFPYGNSYGWGIAHYKKKKWVCNVFAEKDAFTVMMRLTNKQCDELYDDMQDYMKEYMNHKYPCSDGGWIHYRVSSKEHFADIEKALAKKLK